MSFTLLFCAGSSSGEERTQRRYDQIGGLPSSSIFSIGQDEAGFLWVGIEGGGLARFDGREFRPWAREKLRGHVLFARGTGHELVLITEPEAGSQTGNSLHRIAGDGVEPIPGLDGQPWAGVRDACYDELNRLWVAQKNDLFYRGEDSKWQTLPRELLGGERLRRVAPNRGGGVFVVTAAGVWTVDSRGAVAKIASTPWAADAVDRGDGSIFFAEMRPHGGGIFESRDGQISERVFVAGRFNGFVLRGRTVWAAFDSGVVALRPGEPPELLGPAEGVPGAHMVDREGSLWVGTAEGLVQIPEPETAIWNQRDGLPLTSARYLLRTEEGVWVSTWGGICRLTDSTGKWRVVVDEHLEHKWPLMVDGENRLWGKHRDSFLQRVGGQFKRYPVADSGVPLCSARASDGTLWISTDLGLFKTRPGEVAPLSLGVPPVAEYVAQVLEDNKGELWVTSGNKICHAAAARVASGQPTSWACDQIEGVSEFSKLVQTPGGSVWCAGGWPAGGVWRYESGQWRPIAGSQDLPSQPAANLIPSQSGGIWVIGSGFVTRVLERPDQAKGWEVVEELTAWQGLPRTGMSDLIEELDGSLWLATSAGVIRVRADARRARPEPPLIKQTALMVDGRALESNVTPYLPYGSNQIELHFAALSYRNPGLLRYQYRLRSDDPWTDSKSEEPVFRFFDLRPGHYTAEVRASLDGAAWSAQPARIDFEVLSPWYLSWWAMTGLVVLIAVTLFAAHRARVAVLVRLERQRALIAMDLHDEIGSGLGSIGILSGVAASESVKEEQRRELARSIVETAAELGTALTDIVWSLRPDSATLEGLAYRLTQRASRLFPDGSPAFKTDFPEDWPKVDLSLAARHNVLLIASEALHNVARHARAQQVVLGMAAEGRAWKLWVTDDGCGLKNNGNGSDHSGVGLVSMRKRAEGIGARISWSSDNGSGTRVTVVFSPEADERSAT